MLHNNDQISVLAIALNTLSGAIIDYCKVERMYEDEVKIETKLRRGGYLGGGANFLLSDWFAINFDVKYHFIDFSKNHDNSGYEYGIGVSFMWGKYQM